MSNMYDGLTRKSARVFDKALSKLTEDERLVVAEHFTNVQPHLIYHVLLNWENGVIDLFAGGWDIHNREGKKHPSNKVMFDGFTNDYVMKEPSREVVPMEAVLGGGLHQRFEFLKGDTWQEGTLVGVCADGDPLFGNIDNWAGTRASGMRFLPDASINEDWLKEE